MILRHNLVLLLVLIASFAVSCNNEPESKKTPETPQANTSSQQDSKKDIVFYINGRPVAKGQLHGPNLDRAISNEVIYEMALKQNMDKDQVLIDRVERYKKNLLVSKIKSQTIKAYLKEAVISDEDIEAFYEETKNKHARLGLTQIMLDDEETAHKVYSKLVTSQDIDKTIDDEQKQGVVIITKKHKLTRNYDHLFEDLKVGNLTKPVKGTNKYNIYRIDKIDYIPLDQIKQKLKLQLIAKNKVKAIDQYVDKAIKENDIKIQKVN